MAITEVKKNVKIGKSKIEFICPVCKSKKFLEIPNSVIAEAKQLTTMSIAKGLVCDHQFQAFVDKNFQVRGYQRVDFEFESIERNESNSNPKQFKEDESEILDNLILEGNYLEYRPKKILNNNDNIKKNSIENTLLTNPSRK